MYAQTRIDHRFTALAHGAGADRVKNGGANLARSALQVFLALVLWPWLVFLGPVAGQGGRGDDAPGQANGIGCHL